MMMDTTFFSLEIQPLQVFFYPEKHELKGTKPALDTASSTHNESLTSRSSCNIARSYPIVAS
jgi:hypothetical protein